MLWSFILASCLITLLPGPSMIAVMSNAVQRNLAGGLWTIVGVVLADAILLLLTFSGVGTILYASALAFAVVKWCGVAYLLYLGLRQLLARDSGGAQGPARQGSAFWQGLTITMLNPKIIGFFIAFFPQFLDPEQSVVSQLLLLGPLFLLIVFVILLGYAMAAAGIRGALATPAGAKAMKNLSGAALLGCGLFAATAGR